MKSISEYINESSYNNAPQRVKDSIYKIEPIVKRVLEKRGNKVEESTRDEDFNGIDLKVTNIHGKLLYIDVKCSDEKNDNTSNFLFTIEDIKGRSYKNKKTDYCIFINFEKKELVCISFDNLSKLVEEKLKTNKPIKGHGYYILLKKDIVRKYGHSIFDESIKR